MDSDNIGFGHRRLAIIDLSDLGQPMIGDDNNFVISYNGEVFNYRNIRDELIKLDIISALILIL